MAYLTILSTGDQPLNTVVVVPAGRPFTVGRGAVSTLTVRDVKLSRVHCEVSVSGGIAILSDLGSMNGTYVNGKRITSTALKDGDLIQVGYTKLRYSDGEPGAPGAAVKPATARPATAPSAAPASKPGTSRASAATRPKTGPGARPQPPAPKPATARSSSGTRPPASAPAPKPSAPAAPQKSPAAAAAHRSSAPPQKPPIPAQKPPALRQRPPAATPPFRPATPRAEPPPPASSPPKPDAADAILVEPEPELEGPDDKALAASLRITADRAERPRKGELTCSSCRQPVAAKDLKSGAASNVHGQVCCPACIAADPLIGKTVAGYRIDAKLGAGSWSATYKAEQLSMARAVVLRIIKPEVARDSELVTQFLAAVKRGGQISHPNLVRIYDIGRTDAVCYASTEYIDGESLVQLLPQKPGISTERAREIVLEVASAVDIAHRRDVFHRDIRPSNIILNDEDIPKLTGLGFVRSIETALASGTVSFAHSADIVRYWAPECLAEPALASKEADIYSLGAVLYALLTGHAPFEQDDPVELVRAIRRLRPKPVEALRPGVARRLSAVVAKTLAKNPADRYSDCQQLIQDLRGAVL